MVLVLLKAQSRVLTTSHNAHFHHPSKPPFSLTQVLGVASQRGLLASALPLYSLPSVAARLILLKQKSLLKALQWLPMWSIAYYCLNTETCVLSLTSLTTLLLPLFNIFNLQASSHSSNTGKLPPLGPWSCSSFIWPTPYFLQILTQEWLQSSLPWQPYINLNPSPSLPLHFILCFSALIFLFRT